MPYRHSDLIALGPELCEEARRYGKSVNESHLLVHRVLSEVFREDPAKVPHENLHAHLSGRLQRNLRAAA
jgi:hypothetical protein